MASDSTPQSPASTKARFQPATEPSSIPTDCTKAPQSRRHSRTTVQLQSFQPGDFLFGAWNLEFLAVLRSAFHEGVWSLEFGVWSFSLPVAPSTPRRPKPATLLPPKLPHA